jgi:DNA-directed RNA polymerase subunit RPC12/RpoP
MTKEYTCPKCSETVIPSSEMGRKRCPHCGRELMDWDVKPERQQHVGKKKENWLPIIAFAIVVAAIAAAVYFYFRT